MNAYKFPGASVMSEQLNGVLRNARVPSLYIAIQIRLADQKKSVGGAFDAVYLARNKFLEKKPTLKAWIDDLMPRLIEAITPDDEEFRKRLIDSYNEAISA